MNCFARRIVPDPASICDRLIASRANCKNRACRGQVKRVSPACGVQSLVLWKMKDGTLRITSMISFQMLGAY